MKSSKLESYFVFASNSKVVCFSVSKPQCVGVKVVTREPDVTAEMKRATMREKWGLNLLYKITEGRLELCVKKGTTNT